LGDELFGTRFGELRDATGPVKGEFVPPPDVSGTDEIAEALPEQEEFWRAPVRFGSIPVDKEPLGWDGRRGFRKWYPQVMLPTQVVERVSFGHPELEPNRLFWGDNLHVMRQLPSESIDLIYIDPPFDSGADYVRKVELRGQSGAGKLDGEGHTLGEQIQYTDVWANDNYLQFMYERLLLLKELLAEDGSLYVHMNDSRIAPIRCVMDEVFGPDNFRNLIVWYFTNKIPDSRKKLFTNSTEFILFYSKGENQTFRTLETERDKPIRVSKMEKVEGKKIYTKDEVGKGIYIERTTRIMDNVWNIPLLHAQPEREDYPTQKPKELLRRIIEASSNLGDLVLDCFIGSGTTAAVAQKLGRRWIGCDINKGAIQTTSKRLQTIILEQGPPCAGRGEAGVACLLRLSSQRLRPANPTQRGNQSGLRAYRRYSHPLRWLLRRNEGQAVGQDYPLDASPHPAGFAAPTRRTEEPPPGGPGHRHRLPGQGETTVDPEVERWNKNRPVARIDEQGHPVAWQNRVEVIELRTDKRYGKFFVHQPARAQVDIRRENGKIVVDIRDFISPTIIERLNMDQTLFKAQITELAGDGGLCDG